MSGCKAKKRIVRVCARSAKAERSQDSSSFALWVMDSFLKLERAGTTPDIRSFLSARGLPQRRYSQLLEGARFLNAEFNRFRESYPGVDIRQLVGMPPGR